MKKAFVSACLIGIFAVDENQKLIAFELFPKKPEDVIRRLKEFETGQLGAVAKDLKGMSVVLKQPNPATEFLQKNMRRIALEKKFVKNEEELNKFLTSVGVAQVRAKIAVKEKRDKLIIQCVSALNDLDKILNTMSERLREWYGLHYPEYKPKEHEKFVKAVAKYGERERFENFVKSMGMEFRKEDVEMVKNYAGKLKELYELRKRLDKYLAKIVPEELPNTSALLGHLLAARMLAHAGSLEKLAKMPSSTIQLLGAEKALFKALKQMRFKKKKAKLPRFGILFTHPDISGAPDELRGKIARLLAAKVSIAARTDFYTKEDRSKELLEDYKKKLAEVRGR